MRPATPEEGWTAGLHERGLGWPGNVLIIGLLVALLSPTDSLGMDRIRAELGKDTAWTGEPVALIITLYSPGPFSGTASFDFPELPATAFVQAGNPLVGSESIDGGTYLTQRHEFAIYTQRAGDVVIPAFRVRFAGKQTFTSVAEPVEGYTPELRFRSLRPPGTEHLGIVVAASKMDVSQAWQPGAIGSVKAGDVITRTIARRAVGTTAMMLPPIAIETPPGVRHYDAEPIVQDVTERGASLAVRSETIKYQFERPGTFQLPDLAVTWWDPVARSLKQVTLPGKEVDVVADPHEVLDETLAATSEPRWPLAVLLLALGMAASTLRKPVARWLASRRALSNDPATVAARRLRAACRSNAAADAYAAGLQWKRAAGSEGENQGERLPLGVAADFEREWSLLSRHVYGAGDGSPSWNGKRLAKAFAVFSRGLGKVPGARSTTGGLPALNPMHPARRDSD
jgi:hypothetical protein